MGAPALKCSVKQGRIPMEKHNLRKRLIKVGRGLAQRVLDRGVLKLEEHIRQLAEEGAPSHLALAEADARTTNYGCDAVHGDGLARLRRTLAVAADLKVADDGALELELNPPSLFLKFILSRCIETGRLCGKRLYQLSSWREGRGAPTSRRGPCMAYRRRAP